MPFLNSDWKDEVLSIVDENGDPVPTTGWSAELHIRSAPGMTPATLKLSTAGGTLRVGQSTPEAADNGIAPFVAAASMTMAEGAYLWDLKRTDGGRDEWVIGGDVIFEQPITVVGLA